MGLVDDGAIPVKAEPAEVFDEGLVGAELVLGVVKVLDAQAEGATAGAHLQPGVEEGADVAEVEGAGWGGRQAAYAWRCGGHRRKTRAR